jgi:hypothetical protein
MKVNFPPEKMHMNSVIEAKMEDVVSQNQHFILPD